MSRSRFLSITKLGLLGQVATLATWSLVATGAWLASGCSDNTCGTGGAPSAGLIASSADVTLTYGHLSASANNDCPMAGAPAGVVSLTINGGQTDGTGLITLCVPRPDQLAKMTMAFGSDIQIVDLSGSTTSCTFTIDTSRPPSGTVQSSGMCGNGTDKAGFGLTFNGAMSLQRTCGAVVDSIAVTLDGLTSVTAP